MEYLSVVLRGTIEERLWLCFRCFDRDMTGLLNLCEFDDMVICLTHTLARDPIDEKGTSNETSGFPGQNDEKHQKKPQSKQKVKSTKSAEEKKVHLRTCLKQIESEIKQMLGDEQKLTFSQLQDGINKFDLLRKCFQHKPIQSAPTESVPVQPRICVDVQTLITDASLEQKTPLDDMGIKLEDFFFWETTGTDKKVKSNSKTPENKNKNEKEKLKAEKEKEKNEKEKAKNDKNSKKQKSKNELNEIQTQLKQVNKQRDDQVKNNKDECLVQ